MSLHFVLFHVQDKTKSANKMQPIQWTKWKCEIYQMHWKCTSTTCKTVCIIYIKSTCLSNQGISALDKNKAANKKPEVSVLTIRLEQIYCEYTATLYGKHICVQCAPYRIALKLWGQIVYLSELYYSQWFACLCAHIPIIIIKKIYWAPTFSNRTYSRNRVGLSLSQNAISIHFNLICMHPNGWWTKWQCESPKRNTRHRRRSKKK